MGVGGGSGAGLDISVPTFTFDRLATQTRSRATPPWLCDFGERQE